MTITGYSSDEQLNGLNVLYNDCSLIRTTGDSVGFGIGVASQTTNAVYKNLRIVGNTVRFSDNSTSLSPYSSAWGIVIGSNSETQMRNVLIADNVMPETFGFSRGGSSIASFGNRDTDGKNLNNMNQGLPMAKATFATSATIELFNSYVVATASGSTITLPVNTGTPGKEIVVGNESAGSITIAAQSPGQIGSGGTVTLAANEVARFISNGNGKWFRQ